ncbi:hypothetical protein B0T11DRAFT_273232 [Plectosphaerella cucumerina]|uniref:DUF1275 domain protein n=1 Tax=Plectosphaerella cucumerina TaxID=40658 RepID=A0A8K0X9H0_9PEZI|nr:hypothetical protein B0T11DRAFT_273232 [Plectosphaerella cucumerina]
MDVETGLRVPRGAPNCGSASDTDTNNDTPRPTTPQAVPAEKQEQQQQQQQIPASSAASTATKQSWGDWLRDDVHVDYTDLPLMACCYVSGLCDSVTVNAANVFVSMQTGNTVFLALGAAGLPAHEKWLWLRSVVSIVSFGFGCFCFSNTRRFHPKRKATLALSFLVQSAAIFVAAALAQSRVVADFAQASVPGFGGEGDTSLTGSQIVLIPVALLAWQFGGQISSSRMLGFGEVPTCVLTSVYCDLLSDPNILAPLKDNAKRNRRVLAVLLLLFGGISGGWLQRSAGGMTAVLWIAGSIKFMLAVSWTMWRSKEVKPMGGQ